MHLRNGIWAFAIPILALFLAILIPGLSKTRAIAGRVRCEQNLNDLTSAMLTYVDGYEGKYPLSNQWCDLILRDPKNLTEKTFHCPRDSQGSFSYAINKDIFEFKPGKAPAELVLFFEASLGRNGVGSMEEVVLRHDKDGQSGCNISFVDGHVEFVTKDRITSLLWMTENK